jgi:predicted flap endonuclease-1-like 5' DNA nuclease
MAWQCQHEQQQQKYKLQYANSQLKQLKIQYQHTQQQIEKYTRHFNSSSHTQHLKICEELRKSQRENKQLRAKIQRNTDNRSHTPTSKYTVHSSDYFRDDLKKIDGINPKIEQQLNSLGILKYQQIADLSVKDVELVASHLNSPPLPDYQCMVQTARKLSRSPFQAA